MQTIGAPYSLVDEVSNSDLSSYALKDGTNFTNPTTWLTGLGLGDITFTNAGRTQTFAAGNVDFTLASNGHFRINTSGTGMVGINTTTPVCALHVSTSLTTSPRGIMSAQYSTGTDGARFHMRKARGTESAPTVVVTGDDLGRLQWSGYDGNSYEEMASIRAAVTGTVADTRVPTQLIFSTATDATPSVLTDAVWIGSNQYLSIGVAAPTTPSPLYVKSGVSGIQASFESTTTVSYANFYTSASGATSSDGFRIGYAGAAILNNLEATAMILYTAGTERVRILSGGSVGIGTTAPDKALEINSATGANLRLSYNSPSGSASNYADLSASSGGNLTIAPSGGTTSITGAISATSSVSSGLHVNAAATGIIYWNTRSYMTSPSDGVIKFSNSATTDFDRLQLGGTTSSFPAIKRSGTTSAFRLADDSADAPISASNGTFSGYIVGGVQSLSGAGAVNVTQAITEVTTTGAAQALTLADGVEGQEKTIIHGVDGGSAVLTPTTKTGWSTATFTSAGESLTLVFLATRGWIVKSSYLAVVAP